MVMFRQGDVLIMSASTIHKTAKKEKQCILALVEATGHATCASRTTSSEKKGRSCR